MEGVYFSKLEIDYCDVSRTQPPRAQRGFQNLFETTTKKNERQFHHGLLSTFATCSSSSWRSINRSINPTKSTTASTEQQNHRRQQHNKTIRSTQASLLLSSQGFHQQSIVPSTMMTRSSNNNSNSNINVGGGISRQAFKVSFFVDFFVETFSLSLRCLALSSHSFVCKCACAFATYPHDGETVCVGRNGTTPLR
jgi:hypothetical protein